MGDFSAQPGQNRQAVCRTVSLAPIQPTSPRAQSESMYQMMVE